MPGRLRNTLLAGLFALALAGCGSGDEGTIPPADSETLISLTQAIRNDVTSGDCDRAREHANELADQVRALPSGVEPEVRQGLEDAAANLVEQTQDPQQCGGTTGASGETGPETTTSSTATPTTTSTTTEPTTEEKTTTEKETSPGGGQGGGPSQTPPGQETAPSGGGPPAGGGPPEGGAPPAGGGDSGGGPATGTFDPSGGTEAP